MKILIMDKVAAALKSMEDADLFGIPEKDLVIISSTSPRPGLEKVGKFSKSPKPSKDEGILLTLAEGLPCRACFSDGKTPEPVEVVPYATDFNKRNKGLVDESVLQSRTVTIIGLGSGGSTIALDLVRCGVTNLNLIEFDAVSLPNLCRSVYDLPDVGRSKARVILTRALRINPTANIRIFEQDLLEMDYESLMKIIDASDLIIEATDSPKTKILINGFACHTTPVIYPAVYEKGKGGDILFTLPGMPCFECVFRQVLDEMAKDTNREWDYTTGQAVPMPGLVADIQVVCARTVKLALALLTGDQEDSFLEKVIEPGCSLLLISNETKGAGMEGTFRERWIKTQVNPECTCQDHFQEG